MPTPRPKLIVLKCRCGCGQWAAFRSHPRLAGGIPNTLGLYAPTWKEAIAKAIRWSTHQTDGDRE